MCRLAAITIFALIITSAFSGLVPQNDQSNDKPDVSPDSIKPLGAPPEQKIDASTEDSANGLAGLLDIQKMLERFGTMTRGVLAPFQNLNGNTSPFNIRLPSIPDLSKLLGGFPMPLYREGQQLTDSNSTAEGLPTLPPFAPITLPDFMKLPSIAPITNQCVPKLKKEIKENNTYFEEVKQQVDQNNITATYDVVIEKATEICTTEQVDRLSKLYKKYDTMRQNIEALAPEYSQEVKDKVLNWLRNDNMFAITNFITQESMANLFNANKNSKLMQISLQLTSMNFDLLFNPI